MENLNGTIKPSGNLTGEEIPVIIKEKTVVEKDYENLDNKPSINNVILEGNKTPEELGLTKASDFELYKLSVSHSFRGVSESIQSVKTESKTYTDNAIESTKAYSDGKNSDLETAINKTINNKDNATRAYASHLVSEERGARETADEETLIASKSYTDTEVAKVRGYTDTEINKCKEYTDEKIAEVSSGSSYSPCVYKLLENGSEVELSGLQEGINFSEIIIRDCYNAGYVREDAAEETISGMKFIPDRANNAININSNYAVSTEEIVYTLTGEMILFEGTTYRIGMNQSFGGGQLELVDENDNIVYNSGGTIAVGTYTVTNTGKYRLRLRLYKGFSRETNAHIEVSHNTSFHTANNYAVGKEISFSINENDYKITPDTPNYSVPLDILQRSGINTAKMFMSTKYAEVVIVGSTINPAIKRLSNDFNTKIGNINTILEEWGNITVKGNPVQIDGLQGGVPFSELVVSGKNLISYPFRDGTKTINGITFTNNANGTITANGTATANATFLIDRNFGFENEGNYFLSGCPSGGGLNSFYIKWYQNHTGVTVTNYNDYGSGIIIPYQHIFSEKNYLSIDIIAGATVKNVVFRPQIELGDTATAYEPPIIAQGINLWVCKKNLMCYPYWIQQQSGKFTHNGITYTINADMSISANGTATADSYCELQRLTISPNINSLIKNTDYFLSGTPAGGSEYTYMMYAGIYDNDGNRIAIYHDYGSGVSIKIANNYRCTTNILIKKGQTVSNLIFRPQLELGSAATDYEMPSGELTNEVRQRDGLNTISVSVGTLSVTGVRKNATIKRIWEKLDELTAEINGETE